MIEILKNKFRKSILKRKSKGNDFNEKNHRNKIAGPIPNLDYYQMVNTFEYEKDKHLMHQVYWGLLHEDKMIREKSVKIITEVLSCIKMNQLINLHTLFRPTTLRSWGFNWKDTSLELVTRGATDTEQQLYVTALSTFHPNGYFRENALVELLKINDERILPFVLLRVNDWTPSIHKLAYHYVIDYIRMDHVSSILKYLVLFIHTSKFQRNNVEEIFEKVDALLLDEKTLYSIAQNIEVYDDYMRLYVFKKIRESQSFSYEDELSLILKEKNCFVKSKAYRFLINELPIDFVVSYKDELLNDKAFKVQELTIIRLCESNFYKSAEDLFFTLTSPYRAVRECGRFYMRQMGQVDIYTYMLKKRMTFPDDKHVCIGFNDVATKEDFDLLVDQLAHDSKEVVKKTLSTMTQLDFYKSTDYLYKAIKSDCIGISNRARKCISHSKKYVDSQLIHQIFTQTQIKHVKRNTALVLCMLPKWDALSYLIEFSNSKDDELRQIGNEYLIRWMKGYNKTFISPTSSQIEVIERTISKYHDFCRNYDYKIIMILVEKHKKERI